MRSYLTRVRVVISQNINVILFNGSPSETLSARSYREGVANNKPQWYYLKVFIDLISLPFEDKHCRKARREDMRRARALLKNKE